MLCTHSPVSGKRVCTAYTSYVDDLASCIPDYENSNIVQKVQLASQCLDDSMELSGFKQNVDKGESLFSLHGKGSHTLAKVIKTPPLLDALNPKNFCRYLGPLVNWNGGARVQIDNAIKKAIAAFYSYGYFWARSSCIPQTMIAFRSIFSGTLVSGLAAFVLTIRDKSRLDDTFFLFLRKVIAGKGCIDTHDGQKRKIPNQHLLKRYKIPKPSDELMVQRCQWWQQIMKNPPHHELIITSMFGKFQFEGYADPRHPHYFQLASDLKTLAEKSDSSFC